jgi:hypothetical protein
MILSLATDEGFFGVNTIFIGAKAAVLIQTVGK